MCSPRSAATCGVSAFACCRATASRSRCHPTISREDASSFATRPDKRGASAPDLQYLRGCAARSGVGNVPPLDHLPQDPIGQRLIGRVFGAQIQLLRLARALRTPRVAFIERLRWRECHVWPKVGTVCPDIAQRSTEVIVLRHRLEPENFLDRP